MRSTLVVGVPRSGTTWVAAVLARAAGATYLEEPDNHFRFAYAFRAKQALGQGQYPRLAPGARGGAADELEMLWRAAFEPVPRWRRGTRPALANSLVRRAGASRVTSALSTRRPQLVLRLAASLAAPERPPEIAAGLVVKSVYTALCAEWVAELCKPSVVVVLRRPLSVLSSWIALGWLKRGSPAPLETLGSEIVDTLAERYGVAPEGSEIARAAWVVAALTSELEDAARRSRDWHVVRHEALCASPATAFPDLAAAVGIRWRSEGERALAEMSRPGSGYETARLPQQTIDSWRTRLTPDAVAEASKVFEAFRRWS